jgi:hypothetical protein
MAQSEMLSIYNRFELSENSLKIFSPARMGTLSRFSKGVSGQDQRSLHPAKRPNWMLSFRKMSGIR